ncbi:MAG: peptidase M15 [Flavobacteriaceae bacterium]|jgi:D-alanyl-D-alanine dipeptidase|nr:peptidase M15 [Flavobacteriaceae bacterium]|tara:strand:+ start:1532 stop:2194 length:663 start_codon:yes stop_codon:yes gene_type:complete
MRIFAILLFTFNYILFNNNLEDGFVYLKDIDDSVIVDLKYYSTENFTGQLVEGYHSNTAILTNESASALSNAQDDFNKLGYSLILYDAYRPQRAVDFFVQWSKNLDDTINKRIYYPNIKKSELFKLGYIAYKSGHSRGSTVDVSLVELSTNKELDMGTIFDYFGIESHTFSDDITEKQKSNRLILYEIMSQNGFKNYPKEWWHFTLEKEPFKKYFDFLVK